MEEDSDSNDDNKENVTKLDAAISDAEYNFGESELRDSLLKKAEFLAHIGKKDAAVVVVEDGLGVPQHQNWSFLH